jgi:hypothetical protein
MERRYKSGGWFKDNHRHYLAAKYGSSSYFSRKPKFGQFRKPIDVEERLVRMRVLSEYRKKYPDDPAKALALYNKEYWSNRREYEAAVKKGGPVSRDKLVTQVGKVQRQLEEVEGRQDILKRQIAEAKNRSFKNMLKKQLAQADDVQDELMDRLERTEKKKDVVDKFIAREVLKSKAEAYKGVEGKVEDRKEALTAIRKISRDIGQDSKVKILEKEMKLAELEGRPKGYEVPRTVQLTKQWTQGQKVKAEDIPEQVQSMKETLGVKYGKINRQTGEKGPGGGFVYPRMAAPGPVTEGRSELIKRYEKEQARLAKLDVPRDALPRQRVFGQYDKTKIIVGPGVVTGSNPKVVDVEKKFEGDSGKALKTRGVSLVSTEPKPKVDE